MPPKKKAVKKNAAGGKNERNKGEVKVYRCMRCGKEVTDPHKIFYKTSYSENSRGNDHYAWICVECVKEVFEDYKRKYNQEFATKVVCHLLDVPYYRALYESIIKARDDFNFGYYIRQINGVQYQGKSFAKSLYDGELEVTRREAEEESEEIAETYWTKEERRAKSEVIKMMGYDPFAGYLTKERRVMFTEFLGYLDDDELLNDNYKIKQIIQIINNNNQINKYDIAISRLDPRKDMSDIKEFNEAKKALVVSNEKIAKENGISVKARGGSTSGKNTLTGLMRDMREKDISEAEVNFYDQLKSENTQWAIDMSMRSMMQNIQLDENDINEIVEHQRDLIQQLKDENDTLQEECRILEVDKLNLNREVDRLNTRLKDCGGDIDYEP